MFLLLACVQTAPVDPGGTLSATGEDPPPTFDSGTPGDSGEATDPTDSGAATSVPSGLRVAASSGLTLPSDGSAVSTLPLPPEGAEAWAVGVFVHTAQDDGGSCGWRSNRTEADGVVSVTVEAIGCADRAGLGYALGYDLVLFTTSGDDATLLVGEYGVGSDEHPASVTLTASPGEGAFAGLPSVQTVDPAGDRDLAWDLGCAYNPDEIACEADLANQGSDACTAFATAIAVAGTDAVHLRTWELEADTSTQVVVPADEADLRVVSISTFDTFGADAAGFVTSFDDADPGRVTVAPTDGGRLSGAVAVVDGGQVYWRDGAWTD